MLWLSKCNEIGSCYHLEEEFAKKWIVFRVTAKVE